MNNDKIVADEIFEEDSLNDLEKDVEKLKNENNNDLRKDFKYEDYRSASAPKHEEIKSNYVELFDALEHGDIIYHGTDIHKDMGKLTLRAQEINNKLNNFDTTMDERRYIFEMLTGKEISNDFAIAPPFTSDFGLNLSIGKNVYINAGCRFQDQGKITIEDNVLIGHNTIILSLSHQTEVGKRRNVYAESVTLKKDCWVGANVTILPGVTIGSGAIVAAGAVVNKDVEPNTMVAGIPARKMKDI